MFKILFQFHLVRLKDLYRFVFLSVVAAFQFHLVRLKAQDKVRKSEVKKISIPFSTIKRSFGAFRTSLKSISIPFSTIKSFLCVPVHLHVVAISIPFSTIKSMRYCNYQKDIFQFQFHLVRLKDFIFSCLCFCSCNFNSI